MWVVRALLVVILFAVLLGFSVYNANERVAVTILQTRYYNVPLIFVAYWAFIFGLLVSFLLFVTIYFRQAADVRRYKRKMNDLAHEVAALRNRSLDESSESMLPPKKDTSS
jgi:uncharacterized integral membrane protein